MFNLYQCLTFINKWNALLGLNHQEAIVISDRTGTPTLNSQRRKKQQPSKRLHLDDFSPIQSLPRKALVGK
ncbi:hypothetical protein [Coleofasciculus sp. FACHB-1120]|uniref:hypothetical protein n=1 Tax=Coleofasciculus sp. FACHB-1120 TaxID=2692783 RepID=UPI001A7E2B9C|nr:hypothetical protein [Coleofasciculus sp. FACHB-1120]